MDNKIILQEADTKPVSLFDDAPAPRLNDASFPVLHSDALYGLAGDVVAACTSGSEATPPGVLFYFLLRFGCQIGAFPHVPVGEEKHHARLNVVLVGKSAKARKGTSMRPVDAIFEEINKHGLSLATVRNSNLSSGEGLVCAVRDDSAELDKDDNPRYPGVHDKRCLMVSEEFAGALAAMKRQGNSLSAVIRSLWDIGNVDVVTKSEPIKTTGAHVSLMCHITEPELLSMLDSTEMFNGFANRLLWVKVRREKKIAIPSKIDESLKQDIAWRITEALKVGGQPKAIALDDEAKVYWEALYDELSDDDNKSSIHAGITSRAEPYVLRLALIYALLDQSEVITVQHLKSGLACWNYCDISAEQIFGGSLSRQTNYEQKILDRLSDGPCSKTQLFDTLGRSFKAEQINDLLRGLETKGLVVCQRHKLEIGRPTEVWSTTKQLSN